MLTFNSQNLCPIMTKDEMREKAPFIFCKEKTNPNTSGRYSFADTETLVDDMAKLGWGVTDCKQQRANKRSNIHSFHTVAFQNPDIYLTNDRGEIEAFPRIIVSNSHDGLHSFKFMAGVYRAICSNGLVVADAEFSAFSVRHINYDFGELQKIVAQSIELTRTKVSVINDMQNLRLSVEQQQTLATKAIAIRKNVDWREIKVSEEDLTDILEPVRDEDKGETLWDTFNILQEKIIKGEFTLGKTKRGNRRKARPITGAAKDIEVNQALFLAATEYLEVA